MRKHPRVPLLLAAVFITGVVTVLATLRSQQGSPQQGSPQADELRTLASTDVARNHLDYKESKRADEHGNRFRYRARVQDAKGARVGRWAWDVFLVGGQ